MRIAFDLDGTLVKEAEDLPLEIVANKHLSGECLRAGVCRLFQQLLQASHELWVYTISFRSKEQITRLFQKYNLELQGIINYTVHTNTYPDFKNVFRGLHKYPPAFKIDLLVDNLPAIAKEGIEYNFDVIIIRPEDDQWIEKVLRKVDALHHKKNTKHL